MLQLMTLSDMSPKFAFNHSPAWKDGQVVKSSMLIDAATEL